MFPGLKTLKKKIKFNNKDIYEGSILNGKPNGFGTYTDKHGREIYRGFWFDGVPSGEGKMRLPDGQFFAGEFFLGKRHGYGKVLNGNKVVEEGKWSLDKSISDEDEVEPISESKFKDLYASASETFNTVYLELKGEKTSYYPNYYGGLKAAKPHGYGAIINKDSVYFGQFKKGEYHGKGLIVYNNGESYYGDFKNNMIHGYGQYNFADGIVYRGNFEFGKRHGYASYSNPLTKLDYYGHWVNDVKQGEFNVRYSIINHGHIYYDNGTKTNSPYSKKGRINFENGYYEGYVLYDRIHHYGTFYWDDGTKYVGEFEGNKRTGYGTLYIVDGKTIEGYWIDGELHEEVKITKRERGASQSEFTGNQSSGFVTRVYEDGKFTYSGNVVDNKFYGPGSYVDKKLSIHGILINGIAEGYAEIKDSGGGFHFKGETLNDKANGYGILLDNKTFYEGKFIDYNLDGYVLKIEPRNNSSYQISCGIWENGRLISDIYIDDLASKKPEFKKLLNKLIDDPMIKNYMQEYDKLTSKKLSKENYDVFEKQLNKNARLMADRKKNFNKLVSYLKKLSTTYVNTSNKNIVVNTTTKSTDTKQVKEFKSKEDSDKFIDNKFKDFLGLDDVKEELKNILALKRLQGDNFTISDMHMAFVGNAGTGKTSAARAFADIFYESGIIETNNLVETNFSSLYGPYVGHSLQALNEKIQEAQGGVLFIDEAHQLTTEGDDNKFNQELINSLITTLENKRGSTIVILAGYKEPMQSMLKNVDRGLSSRISRTINFRDFKPEELLEIFNQMLSKEKNSKNKPFKLDKEAANEIKKTLALIKMKRGDNFGNARDVRVLVRKVLEGFARISQDPDETIITLEDVKEIIQNNKQKEHESYTETDDRYFD